MGTTQIKCPHCQAILGTTLQVGVGTQMQCGKCRTPFTIAAADLLLASPPPAVAPPPSAPANGGLPASPPSPPPVTPANRPQAAMGILVNERKRPAAPTPLLAPREKKAKQHPVLALLMVALFLLLGMGLAYWGFQGMQPSPVEQNEPANSPVAQLPAEEKPAEVVATAKQEKPVPPPPPPAKEPTPPAPAPPPPPPPKEEVKPAPAEPEVKPFPVPPPKPPAPAPLTEEQKRINAAIDRGVQALRSTQQLSGSWSAGFDHPVGMAALPGLTLLECKVPPDDPAVQRAAFFVRSNCANLTKTYELALAVLFLDRLGDPRDQALIQTLALRLIAGQKSAGGWSYTCEMLTIPQMQMLFAVLQGNRPQLPLAALGGPGETNPLAKGQGVLTEPLAKGGKDKVPLDKKEGASPPKTAQPPRTKGKGQPKVALHPQFLPPQMQQLPPIVNLGRGKGRNLVAAMDWSDNSNTQFALLALWAARRHHVPSEQSLLIADQRFMQTQNPEGGWGYTPSLTPPTPAMTCVGLMGLAMGYGALQVEPREAQGNKGKQKAEKEDPFIQKGLHALSRFIGEPAPENVTPPMENTYFLWSLERVAMLYNLTTIGNKDWYRWGVRILIPNQRQNGTWQCGHYPGATPMVDTCFALLFLKRSNLVRDLSDNLEFLIAIRDPAQNGRPEKKR